jgi:hypothetical protein
MLVHDVRNEAGPSELVQSRQNCGQIAHVIQNFARHDQIEAWRGSENGRGKDVPGTETHLRTFLLCSFNRSARNVNRIEFRTEFGKPRGLVAFATSNFEHRADVTKVLSNKSVRFLKSELLRFVPHVPRVFDPIELVKSFVAVAVVNTAQNRARP